MPLNQPGEIPGEVFFEGGLDTTQSQWLEFFEGMEGEPQSDQFGVDTTVHFGILSKE